jgi:transposase
MNRVCSIFSQILQLFPRAQFQQAVKKHQAERHARGFTCWGQFVAMMFCQVGGAKSLREICNGLMACEGKLKHLGIDKAPNKSTLSYANEHRTYELYETVFGELLTRCHGAAKGKKKFRFKNKLVSMDSTSIDLCAEVFDWAKYKKTKGAVKIHMLLDNEGYLPTFAVITDGKSHDITVGRKMKFDPGTIAVFDMGFVDYDWWAQLTEEDVFFVTRARADIQWDVLEERKVPENTQVRKDQIIRLRPSQRQSYEMKLRVVTIWDEEKQTELQFLTNNLELAARTIARIYKERWQIEIFFKALKQLLRIKTFVGTSANALKIQIWTALIAILVLKYLKLKSTYGWSLSNLVALLRQQLFVYRDLWKWVDQPFEAPPALEGIHDQQLQLEW